MNLCIDAGNSKIKFGLFNGCEIIKTGILTNSEIKEILNETIIDNIGLSSVRSKEKTSELISRLSDLFNLNVISVTKSSEFRLKLNYNSLETLGMDRVLGCEGVIYKYGINESFITVDLGTATTVNYINNFSFEGGIIMPGIITMTKCLNSFTENLPIANLNFGHLIGKTTSECISAGIINSTISLVDKFVDIFSIRKLFFTGGNYKYIRSFLKYEHIYNKNLVLFGINSVLDKS